MTTYLMFTDHNRHTYLQYRDNVKTRDYVAMIDGTIDCIQLAAKDYRGFKKYEKCTPEHFAQVYLNSHLAISRSARAILRGILGQSSETEDRSERASFAGESVTLEEICKDANISPQHARKFLRKAIEKPGGRWAWSPDEAAKILEMLVEWNKDEN